MHDVHTNAENCLNGSQKHFTCNMTVFISSDIHKHVHILCLTQMNMMKSLVFIIYFCVKEIDIQKTTTPVPYCKTFWQLKLNCQNF
jgi:hypothetical protein